MIGQSSRDHTIVSNPEIANIIIINTCAFIQDAQKESLDTIEEFIEWKKNDPKKILIVTGCYIEKQRTKIFKKYPEIDGILNTGAISKINELIKQVENSKKNKYIIEKKINNLLRHNQRILTTPSHYAYLKINDGCNNNCSYCLIPKLRGSYYEKSMKNIISEANTLAKKGIKEIILVGQDVSNYGYKENKLPQLLTELSEIKNINWIRLMYCYPEKINFQLIQAIKNNKKIVKYIDMPIQHINNDVLQRMNRKGSKQSIMNTITRLRDEIPDVKLRTSVMVGFPGETEKQFTELYEFIDKVSFEHLGVFTYSKMKNTSAFNLRGHVKTDEKQQRLEQIMQLQQKISKKHNNNLIGQEMKILIDNLEGGRRYFDAPEIDGLVKISNIKQEHIGTFKSVKITSAQTYDLSGNFT